MFHPPRTETSRPPRSVVVELLEKGDVLVHLAVAVLLLLLAVAILLSSTILFVKGIWAGDGAAPFVERALSYLSDLLFGVIVLELLSTILTYIRSRDLEATIKDFLVVGLISSVRKILLVGAQSSLAKVVGDDFAKESMGVVMNVAGILLLIWGLLLLDKRRRSRIKLDADEQPVVLSPS